MPKKPQTTQSIESPDLRNKFSSISDIIKDPFFITCVSKNLDEALHKRRMRPEPKPGYHYKRDWFDRMSAIDAVNTKFFIENIEDILLKKSKLNSEMRNVIKFICDKSLAQTLIKYSKKQ